MRVLCTGFDPFGAASVNPSWDAVARFAARSSPHAVRAVRLPTRFGSATTTLRAALASLRPDLVICVGLAEGRRALSLERVAINLTDARIADNSGYQPVDEPVVPGGPAAYFTGLPVKACVADLRAAGIPAEISQTAGTYVCNQVFYGLMHLIDTEYPGVRGGFMHVPCSPEMVLDGAAPCLPVDVVTAGLASIVETCAVTTVDRTIAGGAVS